MTAPVLLVTIDTEGDDAWGDPGRATTENARFLSRFQALCDRFGFKPTYLVTYEMASDPVFRSLGRSVVREGRGEIGLHVHAWNSPPATGEPAFDGHPIYITDLPEERLAEKIAFLTRVLSETFEVRPVSHRGGRWAFDERVARALVGEGYLADCSVTPGVSWRGYPGIPGGSGGPDYRGFPLAPYWLDLADVQRAGASSLLEVPVTIRPCHPQALVRTLEAFGSPRFLERVARKVLGPSHAWLRPDGRNRQAMLGVADWAIAEGMPVLEFMLHSSELMAGSSPSFRTPESIERLYADLEALFSHIERLGVGGATLAEFRATWTPGSAVESRSFA